MFSINFSINYSDMINFKQIQVELIKKVQVQNLRNK